jgi:hypothetical protein
MRSPEEINREYADLMAEKVRPALPWDAPAADWAASCRAEEASYRRQAELLDERLGLVDAWDRLDEYAFRAARNLCRDLAADAARRAETFEAEVARRAGGGSGE